MYSYTGYPFLALPVQHSKYLLRESFEYSLYLLKILGLAVVRARHNKIPLCV